MPFGRTSAFVRFLHRLVAVGSMALVVALTLCAASPELHEKLHSGPIGHGEDHCAVALFTTGVSLGVGPITVVPPRAEFGPVRLEAAEQVFLVSPRYLRQPERGPPALG